ncbi:acetate and butyrate kinase [Kangiella koreensis]|uniref:Acetate kinase n=1 Tax=Kangiella koreensis (strain DSM 16069 / JCM 12317 / KCTC 12182 / SW-125) TaxID=523791 RepID=C7RBT9_KANKD|nr:acetate and butyrate kinase [Kangiella koreensis]ACV26731.1 acetate and butyrate kinase [Kangiella koreensis DSM 16069]
MKTSAIGIINPGSATLKWAIYDSITTVDVSAEGQCKADEISSLLQSLNTAGISIYIVRFVHGGPSLFKPTLITESTLRSLESLADLAPLHNKLSLKCIVQLLQLDSQAKIITVFDTEFFHELPLTAQLLGLPMSLQNKYSLRRYGFHGFAHAGMLDFWQSTTSEFSLKVNSRRLVTMQLGSGCSMAAILDNRPIETTMGFTPSEGLLMSTRCGDLDPGLLTWLQKREGWTPFETEEILNNQSGWFGVSGESGNMADLLSSTSPQALLAVELFLHRIRKTLGSYIALLGGLDGIVLSGGIAENAVSLCLRILRELEFFNIHVIEPQTEKFPTTLGNRQALCLSVDNNQGVQCWIMKGNEHQTMLQSVARCKWFYKL